jgi:hypothetical protein
MDEMNSEILCVEVSGKRTTGISEAKTCPDKHR